MSRPLIRKGRVLDRGDMYRFYDYSLANYQVGRFTGVEKYSSSVAPNAAFDGSRDALQETWSMGHTWPRDRGTGTDVGGPFRTRKREYVDRHGEVISLNRINSYTVYKTRPGIRGYVTQPVLPNDYNLTVPTWGNNTAWDSVLWNSRDPFLEAWGTKAIEKVKPTRTANSLYVSLVELKRDGLPKLFGTDLWKDRTRLLRGAGSEYLNTTFGWIPLLSDIKRFASTVNQFEQIWSQYERDAGRLVRRSYRPDPEKSVNVGTPFKPIRFGPGDMENCSSTTGCLTTVTTTVETARWFSGAFTYQIPDRGARDALSRFKRELQRLNHLLGIGPTPDMLWQAAPWTWALDWFTNVGSVVSNLSDTLTDSLVMPYGYVCENTVRTVEVESTGGSFRTNAIQSIPAPDLYFAERREVKQRIQASPYGFGLTWEGFSPTQLAILASLGITRGR